MYIYYLLKIIYSAYVYVQRLKNPESPSSFLWHKKGPIPGLITSGITKLVRLINTVS